MALTLSAATTYAKSTSLDLRKADALSCKSNGLGYFNLKNLKGEATLVSSRATPIVITATTKSSLSFSYRDHEGYDFKLNLNKVVKHQDVDNRIYSKLSGELLSSNSIDPSFVECEVVINSK